MNIRTFTMLCALPFLLAGCQGLDVKHTKPGAKTKTPAEQKPEETMQDQGSDVAFQSFLGRLRKAVAAKDVAVVASLMTPNFGYRLEPLGEGEGVFQYWNENDLWQELTITLNENFVPKGQFMVSPPQFATEAEYHGYRAGIMRVNGSWKFAYFISG